MRRRYINFRPICQARRLPVSSNWPAATPTGHFLSGPSCFSETGLVDSRVILCRMFASYQDKTSVYFSGLKA